MSICDIGIASGYFNPLHRGHIEYLMAAHVKSKELIVIINNDNQVRLKGGTPYINQKDRALIINNMWFVKDVMISIDEDDSISQTLRKIVFIYGKKNIYNFFNSGDRPPSKYNQNEKEICTICGISQHFLELPKVDSSSDIINKLIKFYNIKESSNV